MAIPGLSLPQTPKAKVAADLYADLFILFSSLKELIKVVEVYAVGGVELKPPSFSSPSHVAADGAAFPLDATYAIAIWGANTPNMTALATASYKYFVRISL